VRRRPGTVAAADRVELSFARRAPHTLIADVFRADLADADERIADDAVASHGDRLPIEAESEFCRRTDVEADEIGGLRRGRQLRRDFDPFLRFVVEIVLRAGRQG